jgi:hypothetical protein
MIAHRAGPLLRLDMSKIGRIGYRVDEVVEAQKFVKGRMGMVKATTVVPVRRCTVMYERRERGTGRTRRRITEQVRR